jgi:hypothetical protein
MPTEQAHSHFHPLAMLEASFLRPKLQWNEHSCFTSRMKQVSKNLMLLKVTYAHKEVSKDIKQRTYTYDDADEDDDDYFIDPMKETFDNMQHPMELMLISRECIPYVAM